VGGDLNKEASDTLPVVAKSPLSAIKSCYQGRSFQVSSDDTPIGFLRAGLKRKQQHVISSLISEEEQSKRRNSDIRVGQAPDIFYVDKIVEEKMNKGIKTYKVRWMGYSASEDTWEPASNISARVPHPSHNISGF
jgi:hypothetical protein